MSNPVGKLMEEAVRESVFPGGVLLTARGRHILFHEAYGKADLKENRNIRKDSVFDLASLTKPLATASLIWYLIQNGRLGLDTELGEVIPEVRDTPKARITVNMLLRHTSGLPAYKEYYRSLIRTGRMSREDLRFMIVQEPLEASIGKNQVYSDIGFMFLAWIIENLLDMRLDMAAEKFIFGPLDIQDLFFIELRSRGGGGFDKVPVKKSGREHRVVTTQAPCPWRGKTLTGEVDDDNAWAVGGIEGHAGLFGDALAVHSFCCEVLDGLHHCSKILSPEVLSLFVKKYEGQDMVAGFDSPSESRSSAGNYFSRASIGHLGFTGTSFWIDPETDLMVILLTNRTHPSRANETIKKFRPRIHDAAALYFL